MNRISKRDKKDFIRSFLKQYKVRKKECIWILNYICLKEERLDNIHFVDDASLYDNGLMIATQCDDSLYHFIHYKNHKKTFDAEGAFHMIKENKQIPFYIELRFKNRFIKHDYIDVLYTEENINIIPVSDEPTEFTEIVNNFFVHLEYDKKINDLKQKIDVSLENGDKETFQKLSAAYVILLQEAPEKQFEIIR